MNSVDVSKPTPKKFTKVTLSSGKSLLFRLPQMSDQKEASRLATDDNNKMDNISFMEEFLKRIVVSVFRSSGDEIKPLVVSRLFEDNYYFSYTEVSELYVAAENIIGTPKKKAKVEIVEIDSQA